MSRIPLLAFLLAAPALAAPSPSPTPAPSARAALSGPLAGGVATPYTAAMIRVLAAPWPAPGAFPERDALLEPSAAAPVRLRAYRTPGNDFYIGAAQGMRIHAPVARVRATLDDIASYPKIFDGMVEARVTAPSPAPAPLGPTYAVASEQSIPFPFIPNERNEMLYASDDYGPGRHAWRYQLKRSNHLKASDGFIVIEAAGPEDTLYFETDFWDADWGIAKALAPGRIWRDNLEGLYQADLAVKLRAENPDWPLKQVLEKSRDAADRLDLRPILEGRRAPGAWILPTAN